MAKTAYMTSDERAKHLLELSSKGETERAATLLWEWVKKDLIEFRDFRTLLLALQAR